uniref:Uncharacterized protein LOC114340024 n=1 Tax=Diabrotica virgifera virgifera TaxID=50390 RepID=A0A6P7GB43_DIAVI
MVSKCSSCNDDLLDKFVACDSCHVTVHQSEHCTGLCASELRAVVIQKRTLMYFCADCRLSFKSVPKLIREIDNFKNELSALKQDMLKLKAEKGANSFSVDDVVNELHEREKRSKNILIFNLPELSNTSEDASQVKSILSKAHASINTNEVKILRFGNVNKNGHRPIKVIFSSASDALHVIKNKQTVSREKKIYFILDQTPNQRKLLDSLRSELSERQNAGE